MSVPAILVGRDSLERGREYHVPLHWIEVDKEINARSHLNHSHIRALREARKAGAKWPPLTVALVEEALILIDGFHRYYAANEADTSADEVGNLADTVAVTICSTSKTIEDARWQASRLNWETKLPLTKADREEGVRRYFAASMHRLGEKRRGNPKSVRQVAEELSIPASSFQRLLDRLDGGKYRRMLLEAGEPKSSNGPGDHWRHKRAAKAKEHATALASYGLHEPEAVCELLAQAYRRIVERTKSDSPANLAELVEERCEALDPYAHQF